MYLLNRLAGLPDNSGRDFSQVIDNGAESSLGRRFAPGLAENPGTNGVLELAHGRDAFAARIVLAEQAESRADFIHKMAMALKEANETEYWIHLLHETQYLEGSEFESVSSNIVELLKLLTSIIKTTKK